MRIKLLALSVCLLGGVAGHLAQVRVDPERRAHAQAWEALTLPRPEVIRAVTFGEHLLFADLMWVRAVLRFADVYERPSPQEKEWLSAMVNSVVALDPSWRTAYFYGAGMLRVVGEYDESDAVLKRARQQESLSQDPYFPFLLAMNAWLHHDDVDAAAAYLLEAAALPGAPGWYGAAAAGIVDRERGRAAGLAMVNRQLEGETDPAIRRWLESKRDDLLHDLYAEQIEERFGAALPASGASLSVLPDGTPLPAEPQGGHWMVGTDGRVRSSVEEDALEQQARNQERRWLTRILPPAQGAPAGSQ